MQSWITSSTINKSIKFAQPYDKDIIRFIELLSVAMQCFVRSRRDSEYGADGLSACASERNFVRFPGGLICTKKLLDIKENFENLKLSFKLI